MKILYYVPESDYYYCDDVIMKELEEKKSRQEIFQKVKAMIYSSRVTIPDNVEIEEVASVDERSEPSGDLTFHIRELVAGV